MHVYRVRLGTGIDPYGWMFSDWVGCSSWLAEPARAPGQMNTMTLLHGVYMHAMHVDV